MGGKSLVLVLCLVFSLLALSSPAGAYSFYAHANKLVYTTSESLSVIGNITNYMNQINMTLITSNSTPIIVTNMSLNTSGSNIFSFSQSLSGVPVGTYNASVTDGQSTIFMNFEVVSQITYLEAHLMNAQDIKPVDTSAVITTDNSMGGNFTELRDLSISGTLHYGNLTLDRLYHFVLVDQNYNQTYDTLYVDDDIRFELYNDTEDTGQNSSAEKVLHKGQKFGDYMIGEIEFNTGNRVFLGMPKGSSVYSPSSAVNFIVMAKDSSRNFVPGVNVQARLLNSSKGVLATITNTTNSMGFFISNFTAPSTAGTYAIDLNNSKGIEYFTVESFKLSGKVTDLSGNPAYSFSPNSVARIYANSRDASGNAVNLTSGSARLTYPNGTAATNSLTQGETGVYYYDFSIGGVTGNYQVKVVGRYGDSSQEFITGFSVESVSLQLMAMNMHFIDQAESGAGEVNAFAPSDNVTLMVFLSNISAGGMMSKGPEGMGLIDIDNGSTTGTDECGTLVSLVELRDDRGMSVSVSGALIMNLSRAIAMSGVSMEEQPPQEVMRQCVIIFAAPNRTGTYKAVAQINYNNEIKKAGSTFGIQRFYAEGASVDSKGDDYWFFAPNTTMKIKLKIKDLSTREDLPANNITGAKIIEMYKEFPDFQDVFTASFRASANESVQNGNLVFNAPDAEGFFSMKFKFKAYVNGAMEEGIGNAFFQLKKYMIWATPQCSQEGGQCISGLNKSVTLTVNVVDIDQGSMMSQMGKGTSSLTCTDCEGLVVDVGSLRNDQLMKEMVKGVDFNVSVGMVANATTNITIIPLSPKMQSGWYGMDLIVTDLADTDNTYFGWGGFEVRNFYVETMKITDNGTALFVSRDMGPVFEKGGSAAFALVARDPSTGDMLSISSATLQSIKWMAGWPPTEISTDSVATSVSNSTRVYAEWLPPEAVWYPYVVNITGLDKDGEFQADARVTTSKGSDIGSFFFGLSTYNIEISYRGMDEWKSPFSSSENLTVTFTAMDFGDPPQPHNLSQAGSKLRAIYNDKTDTPIRINTSVTNCTENACIISTPLSSLSSGWYSGEYSINDTDAEPHRGHSEHIGSLGREPGHCIQRR
ncbi:MAG: hypothetical protein NTY20_00685 [Candidatus Aenigmarchaeota archaeon]|nr:hypothetical protein [Candidatus Aenigmarchaeota archaeon]